MTAFTGISTLVVALGLAGSPAASAIASNVVLASNDVEGVTVPGDPAVYDRLNAWRRDDGKIEITTSKELDWATEYTVYLITCAPLALGTIAEHEGPRNDKPELERLLLGSAEAILAAKACGGLR